MDDEFSEFRSSESVKEADLLDLENSEVPVNKPQESEDIYSSIHIFNPISESLRKPAASKKKTFVFPYDLDLNTNSLLEVVASEAPAKPTPWSLMEDIEGLERLAKDLAAKGRLMHSLRCKKHAETVSEMSRIKEIKRIATERADYDTAIQYRNLLGQLEKQLSQPAEIEEWLKDYKETTLADLENNVKKTFGDECAAEFKAKFAMPEIKKSSDIEAAQAVLSSALHYIEIKTILKDQYSVFQAQTQQLLQKISDELSKAITILYKLKPHFPLLLEDTELQSYLKGLPEVYLIAVRVNKVLSLCNFSKTFEKILCEISQNWQECREILNIQIPEVKSEGEEMVCGLCLFASKNLVMLCSSYFHVGCINFWINRVSTEPPRLGTTNYMHNN